MCVFTAPLHSSGHGADPHKKRFLQHLFHCCVRLLRALPSNGSTLLSFEYLLRASLPSRSLAMGHNVTICSSVYFCNVSGEQSMVVMFADVETFEQEVGNQMKMYLTTVKST